MKSYSDCINCIINFEITLQATTPTTVLLDDGEERIIGGEKVVDGDLKYQLSLRFHRHHHCGASLIQVEDTLVGITAAHCSDGYEPQDFTLVAGDVRISDRSGHEQESRVVKIVNHEEYDSDTISNDIGIIFVDVPFNITEWVGPIPLPEQDQETKGL